MPVTLATWEAKISSFGLRPAREKIHETHLQKQPEQNGPEVWLKWQRACHMQTLSSNSSSIKKLN
jgi:hypothetical protein